MYDTVGELRSSMALQCELEIDELYKKYLRLNM